MKDPDPGMTVYLSEGRRYRHLAVELLADQFLEALEDGRDSSDQAPAAVAILDTLAEFDLRGISPPWDAAAPIMREIAEQHARTLTAEQKEFARKRPPSLPPPQFRRMQ